MRQDGLRLALDFTKGMKTYNLRTLLTKTLKPPAFHTTKERSAYLVAELQHSIIADFHKLSAEIGRAEALKFLKKEITSLPF